VRIASADDARDLARMFCDFNAEFGDPTPPVDDAERRIGSFIAAGKGAFLITADGPKGFAQLAFSASIYSDNLGAYLGELYVVPDLRGQGLGRALLEAALEVARERGADHIDLNTSVDDAAARGLYESMGFTNREGSPDGPAMLYYERDL
jgi:ribosomal protein S18 acetylase RimI-like enzyme